MSLAIWGNLLKKIPFPGKAEKCVKWLISHGTILSKSFLTFLREIEYHVGSGLNEIESEWLFWFWNFKFAERNSVYLKLEIVGKYSV